jgi:membrane protein DedA with SNARE-associated domain
MCAPPASGRVSVMSEAITTWVEGAMASPWVLLALFAFAAIDGFFPAVPSESLVVTAGVFAAANGDPSLPLVILAAGLGAFTGDHVSYLVGARAGGRISQRLRPGTKKAAAFDWAGRTLADRGGTILVVCRYIPGARTAVTLTSGAVRFPLRSFSLFDGLAAASWGLYSGLVGFVGGAAFEEEPLKGVVLGLGLAVGVAILVEVVRLLRGRSAHAAQERAVLGERAEPPLDVGVQPGLLMAEERAGLRPAHRPGADGPLGPPAEQAA